MSDTAINELYEEMRALELTLSEQILDLQTDVNELTKLLSKLIDVEHAFHVGPVPQSLRA